MTAIWTSVYKGKWELSIMMQKDHSIQCYVYLTMICICMCDFYRSNKIFPTHIQCSDAQLQFFPVRNESVWMLCADPDYLWTSLWRVAVLWKLRSCHNFIFSDHIMEERTNEQETSLCLNKFQYSFNIYIREKRRKNKQKEYLHTF